MQIILSETDKDKYVLCATPDKGWAYNSLLFWGKDSCGYYPDITKCQLYTKEEVMKLATEEDVPIKLVDLVPFLAIHAEQASSLLAKATK